MNYDELMKAFKKLNDTEKKEAIKEFLVKDIEALSTLNKNIGNDKKLSKTDIDNENDLDTIYELLHVMTDEINSFAEYVENKFYE